MVDPGSGDYGRRFTPGADALSPGGYQSSRPDTASSDDGEASPLVRPYAMTGGRTKPRTQLPIEALVSTTAYAHGDLTRLTPECMAIVDLCGDWRSVAEISALLRMPLGVARIIVADMAEQGLVRVHQPAPDEGSDLNLLERVLSGLRKL